MEPSAATRLATVHDIVCAVVEEDFTRTTAEVSGPGATSEALTVGYPGKDEERHVDCHQRT